MFPNHGAGYCTSRYDVIMNLCRSLFTQSYKLFTYNSCTSVVSLKSLLKKNMLACGTINSGRKGFTVTMKLGKDFKFKYHIDIKESSNKYHIDINSHGALTKYQIDFNSHCAQNKYHIDIK